MAESSLSQWVDGSFVSKKTEPGDIDVVSFVSYKELAYDVHKLDNFKYPFSINNFGVGAYIVLVYPEDHKNYTLVTGCIG